jgi:hypothetical protein
MQEGYAMPGGMFLSHRYQRQHKRRGEIRELPLRKRNRGRRQKGGGSGAGDRVAGGTVAGDDSEADE